uniref:Integrase_H2C2 domain-containing protein n=1 Tax=Heligmosomoides polygyrus TaxID=6339 RepID=A0A8L8K227_HELPZ
MLASEDTIELQRQVQAWCHRLERFGLKLNVKETEFIRPLTKMSPAPLRMDDTAHTVSKALSTEPMETRLQMGSRSFDGAPARMEPNRSPDKIRAAHSQGSQRQDKDNTCSLGGICRRKQTSHGSLRLPSPHVTVRPTSRKIEASIYKGRSNDPEARDECANDGSPSRQHNAEALYSDSGISLALLASASLDRNAGLVGNRYNEIRTICDNMEQEGVYVTFGHVGTDINAADCTTPERWPAHSKLPSTMTTDQDGSLEVQQNAARATANALAQQSVQDLLEWKRYKSVAQATAVFSYIAKVVERVNPDLKESLCDRIPELRTHCEDEFPSLAERQSALRLFLRNHQRLYVEGKFQPQRDRLTPVKDSEGIIRCKGRLQNSDLPENSKHCAPILLGAQSAPATLVIRDAHTHLHLGTTHTIAQVRTNYWIPQRQVQKVVRKCIPCQRWNNLLYRYPALSDLPSRRVTRSRPFQHVGIDYIGPISIKSDGETGKAYGIILTCTTTRLIHLECAPERLGSPARNCFKPSGDPLLGGECGAFNFAKRDDGSNDGHQRDRIAGDHSLRSVAGAFYERLIKTIKQSLYKTFGRSILTLDDLTTLLIEIEGTLNTRPLTYQEEYWSDQPAPDRRSSPKFLPLHRAILEHLERAISYRSQRTTYTLRYLCNNHGTPKVPTPGTVVLIMGPNLPVNTWKMGRITKANANKEGPITVKSALVEDCKRNVALFTCLVTRLTHLKAAMDLSAKSFVFTLKRTTARRGVPQKILSDNGSNFHFTENLLRSNRTIEEDPHLSLFLTEHRIP